MKIKILVGVGLIVILGVVGTQVLKKEDRKGIEVETGKVELAKIVQKVNATGKIQPKTQVNISADVSAKITRLDVKEGDWVEKGQFLV
jgi:HlyD family secretion protein